MAKKKKDISPKDPLVKVAGIQMVCHREAARKLEKALGLIDMASEEGARIIDVNLDEG